MNFREYREIMKKVTMLIVAGCFALLVGGCGESPVASVGKPAPSFDTVDMQGNVWSLNQQKGQVIFLNFWATWCEPCREEMPSMQRLYTRLPKDKFQMVALYNKDNPKVVNKFVKQLGITIPILNDEQNIIGQRYGLTGLPETFIIDKQGVIREKFIGPAEWDSPEVVDMITKYINE